MPEADVTYADVKFSRSKARENISSSGDATYSEVRISEREQPANVQQGGSSRRSKVTSVVLLVFCLLLVAALIALGVTNFINYKSQDSLKEENEALRKHLSEMKANSSVQPTCPPPPETQTQTCLKCGAGWEEHGGKCYYFNTNRTSWSDSRASCRDLGGDLVKIDSREEQEFLVRKLRGLMEDFEDKFWIGLTDSETEGRWLWADGSPLNESLSFWNTGEPNDVKTDNSEGEDCVGLDMRGRDGDLKTWNDQSCDIGYRGICEKPAVTGKTSCV
ncbi:C-type lectin domain family 4 member E isoform X3 [Kryptolebias marmoratus]|uniref:C-type lectin domain family 4 member E isoform X3 n=1 Tax=Kryptolebias marmoratus TaxID=37003 RepID=UPI000D52F2AE|nr:C-type lectin domain family 4 member E isoform X3 [Kryptolebias marmoratus]